MVVVVIVVIVVVVVVAEAVVLELVLVLVLVTSTSRTRTRTRSRSCRNSSISSIKNSSSSSSGTHYELISYIATVSAALTSSSTSEDATVSEAPQHCFSARLTPALPACWRSIMIFVQPQIL